MKTFRFTATALVLAAATALPSPAAAGTYQVEVCRNGAPPTAPGWSVDTAGESYQAQLPRAWWTYCGQQQVELYTWPGVGADISGGAKPGARGILHFTPPPGVTITALAATNRDKHVSPGSLATVSMWTSAGRALEDPSPGQSGAAVDDMRDLYLTAAQLGADGAAGLSWGARCDINPADIFCGAAGYAMGDLKLTLDDASDPTITTSVQRTATTVTIGVQASDPQTGIRSITATGYQGVKAAWDSNGCTLTSATPCPVNRSGAISFDLDGLPSTPYTYVVKVLNGAGMPVEVTVTAAGLQVPAPTPTPGGPTPTPPPGSPATPPPPPGGGAGPKPTPKVPAARSRVTISLAARKGRKLRVAGKATGCSAVTLSTPRRKKKTVLSVRRGRWGTTVARKAGKYQVTCGTAKATRKAR